MLATAKPKPPSHSATSRPNPCATKPQARLPAVIAPVLGRNLSGGAANLPVTILEPGSMYGERLNQVDLRVGKILRFGRTKSSLNLDLYNLFNANTVLTQNNSYGAWQAPQSILDARFAKVSAQFDF